MKSYILSLLFISILFINCNGQNNKNYESIAPTTFEEKIKQTPKAQLIDVRSPEEYTAQHIDKAVNINWNSDEFTSKVKSYDKEKPIFVYCLSGGRSKQAANKLQEMGFKEIYELQGGIMKWNAEGLAKKKNEPSGMTKAEFDKLLRTDKKVLVDFYAEWCGPCKKMAPYLKKMESEMKDKLVIIRIDADKNKTLVEAMKVDGLPMLFLYENQKQIWKNMGYISEEDLKKHL
jgi:thioredoxin